MAVLAFMTKLYWKNHTELCHTEREKERDYRSISSWSIGWFKAIILGIYNDVETLA